MILLIGLVLFAGAAALFWYLLPTEGRLHPLATAPVLESLLPIAIIVGFAAGLAMMLGFFA